MAAYNSIQFPSSSTYTVKTKFIRSLTLRIRSDGDDDASISSAADTTISSPSYLPTSLLSTPGRKGHRNSGSCFFLSKMMAGMNSLFRNNNPFQKEKKGVTIASIEGHAALSHICVGDFLCVSDVVTRINGVNIGPSYSSERCYDLITNMCYNDNDNEFEKNKKNNGILLSIQTGNDNGLDKIVLQATVLKPYPDATAKELGIEVCWWNGYGFYIRDITSNSFFGQSGIRITDELESINGISLLTYNNDKITKKEDFDRIVQELPCDITLVVKRR